MQEMINTFIDIAMCEFLQSQCKRHSASSCSRTERGTTLPTRQEWRPCISKITGLKWPIIRHTLSGTSMASVSHPIVL